MSSSTMRKAIGAVKDQTSIGIAKVASNTAPDLEVAIVKAMTHDDDPTDEKYIREILTLTSYSRMYVNACVAAISKRLGKTRDWVVGLKALMLVHRLLSEGDPVFQQEILYATRKGTRLLNLSDFRDEAHSNSWDHSAFVRTYALYLDQKLECLVYEKKRQGSGGGGDDRFGGRRDEPYRSGSGSGHDDRFGGRRDEPYRSPPGGYGGGFRDDFGGYGTRPPPRSRSYGDVIEAGRGGGGDDERKKGPVTPLREMKMESVLGRMSQFQRLLDRFLSCRPTGLAKNSRMVMIALYQLVKESFQLYADICEILAVLLDQFFEMEYSDCVKAFEAYTSSAKQIDELVGFYNWCKDTGVARSSEFPEVQRISDKLLETLEEFVRDRSKRTKSPERKVEALPAPPPEEEEVEVQDMNEIKALPAPENYTPPPPPQPEPKPQVKLETGDLLNLADDAVSAEDQSNRLALALFSKPAASGTNGSWEAFPSNGESEVTSAWQTPAAETGKADWELALVESASNLSKQKAAMGGGLDPLLLNGMYDQGTVRQHASTSQLTGGSASSVAILGPGKTSAPVLALPAPDGTIQAVGQDPFAASLTIPPPSYVQMAEIEKKQQLLMQEQQLWMQYAREGMQGQVSLAKIGGGTYAPGQPVMMPYGMPPVNGMGPSGYYYTR
ncbi:hypothetical protein IFM89_038577 [Coptis chinensis]|uniref:ENTH domain-containing protein n=1 Tax=Coptis chinensis TaxID=261450 RepID=A0A835LL02_9MAGN|nr:hypothetical protein IFM89_038577 [Coptis chinensis]